jgi:NADPH-dependent 2,4-dienoyl-CoA reductase/sulfur reductase-like enzyme/peroxiredoxin family protein/TusA-related sulfurtransferase/rhodanese-related sulfurtransferase
MKIIIIGGVAGGATAAARLRRLSEKDEIIILERDEYISYANCGLPYYIGDVITDKQKLQVQTVKGMSNRFNLDIRVKNEVIEIDLANKKVKIKNLESSEITEENYDKLIMSCGAKPIKPNIEGLKDADNVFTLRNIPDTYEIKDFVTKNTIKKAVVVGGGFIGIEMAENLTDLGIEVTLVEKLNQVLRPFDFEMAQIIHNELNNHGVELILGDGITAFSDNGKKVNLESGKAIDTDMTVLAIGVTPENTLAKNVGILLGGRGHVKVDNYFNVSDSDNKILKDVYAIGDMIEVINPLDNSNYAVPLAWGANRQGRLVADIINGKKVKQSTILGASVLKVFDLISASVGNNEATLKQKGIKYTAIHAHRANHASYYPNSSNIALKLIYNENSGEIYGAQAIGRDGTEKRIDVISTVMRLKGTVYDLSDLELCYAPPFSSAKDPVNILGYIAENIKDNAYNVVHHDEIDNIIKDGGLLLDVRSEFEYNAGHIEGSKNLDIDSLRKSIDKIDASKDSPIYVTCQVGLRGYLATNVLRDYGFTNLYNLSGGYLTYKNYKYNLNKPKTHKEAEVNDLQSVNDNNTKEIDVTGIQCPGPLMATYKALETMNIGEKLKITATDSGFKNDIENWCESNGHQLLNVKAENGNYIATVQKGNTKNGCIVQESQKNATIVVFSGELDKLLASMIIAQGAAAQGKNVTVFFTFWGLNALRRNNRVKVKKSFIEKMFGSMMPRGAKKLKLSNMNMLGMGSKMIKGIMKKKNVDDLPTMIKKAQEVGVQMIACTMSMDLMGIKEEELIDGVKFAGVATYISKNENVGTTLFI